MNDSINSNFIVCPNCQGKGKNNLGVACPNCAGCGLGTFFHGRFFYWGPKLGRAMIELSHFRKKIHLLINILAFTLGFIGLLSLGFWAYLASGYTSEIGAFAFWREKHILILLFWLSMAADMFVMYRLSEEERQRHKIKKLNYEESIQKQELPDNWDELRRAAGSYKIDVSGGFNLGAYDMAEDAYLLAAKLEHEYVTPLHLFFSCLADKEVAAIFSRLNVDGEKFLKKIKGQIAQIDKSENKTQLSKTVREVFIEAYINAYKLRQKKVSAKNFIIPCLKRNNIIKEILLDFDVNKDKIFNVILWFIINEQQVANYQKYKSLARFKPSSNMDRAYTSVATPMLKQIAYDLTLAAKFGRLEYCVAREKEIEAIWQYFESGATGAMLVGPVGTGKNAIIGGIAQLMVEEDVPKFLQDKRLVELDASRLISGASPAQAQGRLMAVIDEIVRAGNIVLYVNNIENLMGISSGSEESLDLSEILAGAIERRSFYCFASATDVNYVKYIENSSLGNILPKVDVKEPEGNQAIQIIESKIGAMEGKYKVYFSYNAIEQSVVLSSKYLHDKYLPEKAIEILEGAAVKVLKTKGEHSMVGKEDIAASISLITNIPITKITEDEGRKLLQLEEEMHKRMIAQDEAVNSVASSLRRARTQLREADRPIANFLFLGPTGVGKTELAKTVSEVYFGKEEYMIRVDMSEYQHPDSIKKMIGDASGARGYLTEKVRKSPFSLILLDEIEKAHKDILNVFLQVMDDGRLTDGQGRTIDFTNVIIIATSNAGAIYIQNEIYKGTPISEIKNVLINEHLKNVMRPELINRFDGVIVFEPLSFENVVDIAKILLEKLKKALDSKGISLRCEEQGVRILAKQGFDPKFGARPLKRLLRDKIEDEIANLILAGALKRRDTVIIDEMANVKVEKGVKI
ncbi:ATP-dependent Clp protease ATP-binding subunit [Candidatus Parcubacteria bacterium]|nr:ATP-dependent Clp protease ATP-binding subunit [Candidatus Parcubacteria bacterium]